MRLLIRSEEHTSELQSHSHLVCRLLLEKKKKEESVLKRSRMTEPLHVCAQRLLTLLTLHPIAPDYLYTCMLSCLFFSFFFFLNNGAPPKIYPFPHPDPFRI